jgi:hypothetical protein
MAWGANIVDCIVKKDICRAYVDQNIHKKARN